MTPYTIELINSILKIEEIKLAKIHGYGRFDLKYGNEHFAVCMSSDTFSIEVTDGHIMSTSDISRKLEVIIKEEHYQHLISLQK